MTDIATLGLAVDARQVVTATKALDNLTASAKPAAQSAADLSKAANASAAAFSSSTTAAQPLIASHKGLSTQAMAAQHAIRSATEQLAAGVGPAQAFSTQIGRLAYAAGGPTGITGAFKEAVGGITKLGQASNTSTTAVTNATKAANAHGEAHRGMSTQAMAAQHAIRSMGEQLALGVPISQVFTQQLNHLSYAASGPGGLSAAFKGAFAAFAGLLSPMALVAIGTIGLGFVAYATAESWKKYALEIDEVAKRSDSTSTAISKLRSAASFKGIDGAEFNKGITAFTTAVYQAQTGVGGLAEVFRANNVEAKTFDEYLNKAADLIKNAGSEKQKEILLTQMGLPATREWVEFLEKGADGLARAKESAAQFGGITNDRMVEAAKHWDEMWNRISTNFGIYWKNSFTSVVEGIKGVSEKIQEIENKGGFVQAIGRRVATAAFGVKFGDIDRGQNYFTDKSPLSLSSVRSAVGVHDGPDTKDPEREARLLALESQRLRILGNLLPIEDQLRLKEIELIQARASGIDVTDKDQKAILAYTEASALGTLQIRQQTGAQIIETQAVGLALGAAAAFRAEQEKLLDFRLRGISLTREQANALRNEASALGEATQAAALHRTQLDADFAASQLGRTTAESQVATQIRQLYGEDYQAHLNDAIAGQLRLNSAMTDFKQVGESALSGLLRDLRDGKSATESFKNVLTKLQDKLFDIASNQIFSQLLGKNGSGGILSGLIGGENHTGYGPGDAMGPDRYISSSALAGAPRYHAGIGPGERAAVIRKDESVLTPGQMRALGSRMGGGAVVVNPVVYNNASDSVEASTNTRQNPDGSFDIEVSIERIVNRTIAGGRADKSLRRVGASPVIKRR